MSLLLQTNPTTVGLVNASIIVLVVIFLTLPTVFVLAEYLRNRRNKPTGVATSASASATSLSAPQPVFVPVPVATTMTVSGSPATRPPTGVQELDAGAVEHDFTREAVPPTIGYLPPGTRIDGDVGHAGHLQLAPRSVVAGGIDVTGSLALGEGAYVLGSVVVAGNLYLRPGARLEGRARVGGNVYQAGRSRANDLDARGTLELEEGAVVEGLLQAAQVIQVERVHQPRLRSEPAR